MIPKIIIRYNRFLDPIFIEWVKGQEKLKNTTIPSQGDVFRRIKNYCKLWDKQGSLILRGITKVTGLTFKRNQIDIHVVSVNPRSFSSPIIIKSRYNDIDFINTITHELIHCLFSDNSSKVNKHISWDKTITGKDICNDHVILHAILKYIYLDVLKSPKNLKENILLSRFPGNEGYAAAWKIVEKISYEEIIREFKRRLK